MHRQSLRWLVLVGAAIALVALMVGSASGTTGKGTAATEPVYTPGTAPLKQSEEDEEALLERDIAFVDRAHRGHHPARQPAGRRAARRGGSRGGSSAQGRRSDARPDDVQRALGGDRPEPDLPDPAERPGRDRPGERPDRRARDPRRRHLDPRGGAGRHLALERGDEHVDVEDRRAAFARDRRARRGALERLGRLRRHRRGRDVGRQLLRQRRAQVDRRRQYLVARLRRLLPRGLDVADRRRPDECRPRVRGGAAWPRRRTAHAGADPLPLRHLGVDGRRRELDAPPRGAGRERRHRPRDRPAEPAGALRVLLERRDLQEHGRRPQLDADHERAAARGLRRGADPLLDRPLASRRPGHDALRRLRLAGRRRLPQVARLQVRGRRRELGDHVRPAPASTPSRTTAAASAGTTT